MSARLPKLLTGSNDDLGRPYALADFPFTLAVNSIRETGTHAWHEDRLMGICGSDAPAILGLSHYRTPYDIWTIKRRLVDPNSLPVGEEAEWGHIHEPAIARKYVQRTGLALTRFPMLRHPKYAWMLANVDGIGCPVHEYPVREVLCVAEFKTARYDTGWGEEGTDQIPVAYRVQVEHYLAVTGLLWADVVVLIGGSELRFYRLHADLNLRNMIIEAEQEFMQCVNEDRPPALLTMDDARKRWPVRDVNNTTVVASVKDIETLEALRETQQLLKELELTETEQKLRLMNALGYATELLDPRTHKPLATWRTSKAAMRWDTEALDAQPELVALYKKAGEPVRRFLTTKSKR